MAHTSCPNGHDMWNGDGKPVVWAYRVNFFRDFMKEHPDCVLDVEDENNRNWQIYDCVDDIPGEDLDCWYCDECQGLTVFADIARYDFNRMAEIPKVSVDQVFDWEEYIALRDQPFEDFQDYYEGMDPLTAIETYDFEYKYRVSPDQRLIYAFDKKGKCAFAYERSNYMEFAPELELGFGSGEHTTFFKPFGYYEGKRSVNVKVGLFAHLKNGKLVQIKEIVEPNKIYVGQDVKHITRRKIKVKHHEITKLVEVLTEDDLE